MEDHNLDSFFRNKTLSEADELGFDEQAWDLMERKLNKRDRIIFYKKASLVILLLFSIGFGTYFLKDNKTDFGANQISKNQKTDFNQKKDDLSISQKREKENLSNKKSELAIQQKNKVSDKNLSFQIQKIKKNEFYDSISLAVNSSKQKNVLAHSTYQSKGAYSGEDTEVENVKSELQNLSANNEISKIEFNKEEAINAEMKELVIAKKEPEVKATLFSKALKKQENKTPLIKKEDIKWGLSFSLGPENNTVNGLGSGKTNLNGGVLLQANFNEKFILRSGILYVAKNYNANAQQYSFQTKPYYQINNITAICDVVELPFTAGFLIAKSKKGAFYLNTGLSSFLMIREQYTWQYNANASQPDHVIIKNNANQHFLSVLELSSTYQFKVNGKINLGISPYVKLPLGGIGEGAVKLRSTGINLNYNYDFRKKQE